jgi:hypothetical protein
MDTADVNPCFAPGSPVSPASMATRVGTVGAQQQENALRLLPRIDTQGNFVDDVPEALRPGSASSGGVIGA